MYQDYQARQPHIEESNLSGPIRTSHNSYSHRQPSATRATTQEFLVFIRHPEP